MIIIFVYLLLSGRLITKLIEISRYLYIGISNGRSTYFFLYKKSSHGYIFNIFKHISVRNRASQANSKLVK